MTLFGWDASHYDGMLTRDTLVRARSEGISFFTHKIAEGLQDTEGTHDDTALAAARDAGIEFVGGYLVPRSNVPVDAQVDRWIALADAGEPWWRDFPGWFWQVDLERWPYDNVPASVGVACANRLRDKTGRWTILYASNGQYRDQLTAWRGPLWNADYSSRTITALGALYPGDAWAPNHGAYVGGWASYSGAHPTFLQYTSSATIAGLTTCDANAFRGTAADLRALIVHTPTPPTQGDDDMLFGTLTSGFAFDATPAASWVDAKKARVVTHQKVGPPGTGYGSAWLSVGAPAPARIRYAFSVDGDWTDWSDADVDLFTVVSGIPIPAGTVAVLLGRRPLSPTDTVSVDVPVDWSIEFHI